MNLENFLEPFSPPETNFVERLRYWALAQPEAVAIRFINKDEKDGYEELNYAQFDERVRAIAAKLTSLGLTNQRALMMYPPGIDFVAAFSACHYAGVIPVPAYPPRRNRNMDRINAITEDAETTVALTVQSVIDKRILGKDQASNRLNNIEWVPTEKVPLEIASDWVPPKISPNDLGLIQYTSGSTGSPKGVMLTHKNLLANCRMIKEGFEFAPGAGGAASWLPFYHDMGLIGGILTPFYNGFPSTTMSPITFLTKPIRWLRAIDQFKAECSGGPNFAYALCNMKITPEQCEGLDLSNWKVAFNGAEPVRADVMEEFSRKFEPYGFDPRAFYPCYGMAETTLIVTGGKKDEPPIVRTFDKTELAEHRVVPVDKDHKNAKYLVGCGQVLPREEVIIVNPETRRVLTDDKIGEIWIDSPSSGQGYWNKPEISEEVFRARTSPDNGKNYVRSGDLGFMYRGELFVSGRLKDMIIIRGVNHYPQDIEATIERCDSRTRNGGSAAFAFQRWDREHLVVVCEVQRQPDHKTWDDVIDKIRAAITEEHDIPPDAIVLVRAHSVPKTSSGKVQRHACRQKFENDELPAINKWIGWEEAYAAQDREAQAAASAVNGSAKLDHAALAGEGLSPAVVEAVIYFVKDAAREQAKELTIDTNIVRLGLDSLVRTEIAANLQTTFGGVIPEEVLQESETVREVALAIQTHVGTEPVVKDYKNKSANNGSRMAGPVPESYYKLEKMPEFVRLQRMKKIIESTGLRNPFFSVHEGRIADTTSIDGRELISFASYNYLGLAGHPEVSKMAKDAVDRFGTSVSASRIVSGEKTIHKDLERELAEFLGTEDVITFPGGHATNESVIGHLVGPGDLIIHDSLAHNSIIQGAELSRARRRPFEHNNWQQLDEVLGEIRDDYRRVLIAIEGLYSMDGDFPELDKFVAVKKRHKAWLYVDEAHSIGTMGATGRGVGEVFNVARDEVECWMGTLSKSLGSCGGFVAGTQQLIEYLRYTTPGYVFAAGMPPANVGAALGALRILRKDASCVKQLQANSKLFLDLARTAGLDTGMSNGGTPIIPIITGSSLRALRLSEGLFNAGINANPILHPAVPEKETRVRIFMTAEHTEEQIRHSVNVISEEWEKVLNRIQTT